MSKPNPVIKWSGSKSAQSSEIINLFPEYFGNYHEPFVGGGSIMYHVNDKNIYAYDICEPLINFWILLKESPDKVADEYSLRWDNLQKIGYEYYYEVRERFNKNFDPNDLLFLSRTCVNGLIRFNKNGEFNNSFHHSRKGINPESLRKTIKVWSSKISKATFICDDFEKSLVNVKKNDLVYLDPPYFNTKGRYYGGIDFNRFIKYLEELNHLNAFVIMSFDGTRGDKEYTYDKRIDRLFKRKILIKSGLSSFRKVIDKKSEQVYESLLLNWE